MSKFKSKERTDRMSELTATALIKNEIMIQVLSELLCKAQIMSKYDIEQLFEKKMQQADDTAKSIEDAMLKLMKEAKEKMYDDTLKNTPDDSGNWGHA